MTFEPYCDRATRGFTFLEPLVATFEGSVARYFYTYQDDSTRFFEPVTQGENEVATDQVGYEAEAAPGGPCNDSRFAMHLKGGPFRSWGGGFGLSTRNIYDRSCRYADDPPSYCPESDAEYSEMVLDLSEYEGISFWARRGPDGQSGIRVMAGDKHIDDDLSFLSKKAAQAEALLQEHAEAEAAAEAAGEEPPPAPVINYNPENPSHDDYVPEDVPADPADDAPPYETPLYCERKKECGCTNHKPCTWVMDPRYSMHTSYDAPVPDPRPPPDPRTGKWTIHPLDDPQNPRWWAKDDKSQSYCFDPAVDPKPNPQVPNRDECGRIYKYDVCGRSKCDEGFPAWADWSDPQFGFRDCVQYAFPGSVYGDYCYEPGVDPDPPDNQYLCGDYWFDEVQLTTDWEFYTVPFTDMHQQGWAMESFEFDLTAVSVIRFTWGRGWLDFWLDDVSFYKREP